ncbi:MAG: group 1 truncated hemoglobin [Ponticaulis sp.]|nr:group 1 truncated hemoglobin [Ponticaulis sp.]
MSKTHPDEFAVAPYEQSNANAGADPIDNAAVLAAFGGKEGIDRLVENFSDRIIADPRIEGIFRARDDVRFRRTLKEHFCYLLGAGCDYTGMDMERAHVDHGITEAEFNAVVQNLQLAMNDAGIPFRMQNKFLAVLAPMQRSIVTR